MVILGYSGLILDLVAASANLVGYSVKGNPSLFSESTPRLTDAAPLLRVDQTPKMRFSLDPTTPTIKLLLKLEYLVKNNAEY